MRDISERFRRPADLKHDPAGAVGRLSCEVLDDSAHVLQGLELGRHGGE